MPAWVWVALHPVWVVVATEACEEAPGTACTLRSLSVEPNSHPQSDSQPAGATPLVLVVAVVAFAPTDGRLVEFLESSSLLAIV